MSLNEWKRKMNKYAGIPGRKSNGLSCAVIEIPSADSPLTNLLRGLRDVFPPPESDVICDVSGLSISRGTFSSWPWKEKLPKTEAVARRGLKINFFYGWGMFSFSFFYIPQERKIDWNRDRKVCFQYRKMLDFLFMTIFFSLYYKTIKMDPGFRI